MALMELCKNGPPNNGLISRPRIFQSPLERLVILALGFLIGSSPIAAQTTYMLINAPTGFASLWNMSPTNATPSTDNTTIATDGRTAAGNFFTFQPGLTNGTAIPALPGAFTQMGWSSG